MVATSLLWLGCLLVFMASPHQKLCSKQVNKKFSWFVFTLLTSLSWLLFCAIYSMVIAAIVVLALIMAMWTAMILLHGHLKTKLLPFALVGGAIAILLVQLGGSHVG